MKRNFIGGGAACLLGLLIALGPQFIFKVCDTHSGEIFRCYWMGRVELSAGFLIALLGVCLIIFSDPKINLGLFIALFLAGIIAALIPFDQITGVCKDQEAACKTVTFPVLVVLGALVALGAIINMIFLEKKTKA